MKKKGFTLIEIMIVVVILAALSSMVVPRLSGRSEQAQIAIAKTDINSNISLALKLFELDNGSFPTTEQGLEALITRPTRPPVPDNWNGPYLEREPVDPWGNKYQYSSPGTNNPATFDLYSFGPDGVPSENDITNWDR